MIIIPYLRSQALHSRIKVTESCGANHEMSYQFSTIISECCKTIQTRHNYIPIGRLRILPNGGFNIPYPAPQQVFTGLVSDRRQLQSVDNQTQRQALHQLRQTGSLRFTRHAHMRLRVGGASHRIPPAAAAAWLRHQRWIAAGRLDAHPREIRVQQSIARKR
jgi:hypothetical protein